MKQRLLSQLLASMLITSQLMACNAGGAENVSSPVASLSSTVNSANVAAKSIAQRQTTPFNISMGSIWYPIPVPAMGAKVELEVYLKGKKDPIAISFPDGENDWNIGSYWNADHRWTMALAQRINNHPELADILKAGELTTLPDGNQEIREIASTYRNLLYVTDKSKDLIEEVAMSIYQSSNTGIYFPTSVQYYVPPKDSNDFKVEYGNLRGGDIYLEDFEPKPGDYFTVNVMTPHESLEKITIIVTDYNNTPYRLTKVIAEAINENSKYLMVGEKNGDKIEPIASSYQNKIYSNNETTFFDLDFNTLNDGRRATVKSYRALNRSCKEATTLDGNLIFSCPMTETEAKAKQIKYSSTITISQWDDHRGIVGETYIRFSGINSVQSYCANLGNGYRIPLETELSQLYSDRHLYDEYFWPLPLYNGYWVIDDKERSKIYDLSNGNVSRPPVIGSINGFATCVRDSSVINLKGN